MQCNGYYKLYSNSKVQLSARFLLSEIIIIIKRAALVSIYVMQ